MNKNYKFRTIHTNTYILILYKNNIIIKPGNSYYDIILPYIEYYMQHNNFDIFYSKLSTKLNRIFSGKQVFNKNYIKSNCLLYDYDEKNSLYKLPAMGLKHNIIIIKVNNTYNINKPYNLLDIKKINNNANLFPLNPYIKMIYKYLYNVYYKTNETFNKVSSSIKILNVILHNKKLDKNIPHNDYIMYLLKPLFLKKKMFIDKFYKKL